MRRVIVGLVGQNGSGKGTVSGVLVNEFGFYHTSLSDRIREELKRRGQSETRELMQNTGAELREKFGNEVLVKRTEKILEGEVHERVVLDSIKNPSEVEYIKKKLGGIIVVVEASAEKRFELMKKRGRAGDPTTWEQFLRSDQRENRDEESFYQDINKCIEMADIHIENDGTIEELWKKIREELIPQLPL